MQWMPPPRSKSGRASTPTTRRPGYASPRIAEGRVVLRVAEGAGDDAVVDDEVVDVGPVDRPLGVGEGPRRRHADDLEALAPASRASVEQLLAARARRRGRGAPGRAARAAARRRGARSSRRCRRGRGCRTRRSRGSGPRGSQTHVVAPIVRASSASTSARVRPGLRPGSSCTVSVSSTVPSPSTWMPPPSLTSGEPMTSAPAQAADEGADPGVVLPRRPRLRAPAVEHPVDRAEARAVGADRTKVGPMSRIHASSRAAGTSSTSGCRCAAATSTSPGTTTMRDRLELDDRVRDRGPRAAGRLGHLVRRCHPACSPGGPRHPRALVRSVSDGIASRRAGPPGAGRRRSRLSLATVLGAHRGGQGGIRVGAAGREEREQLEPVAALREVEVGDEHRRLVARGLHEDAAVRVGDERDCRRR